MATISSVQMPDAIQSAAMAAIRRASERQRNYNVTQARIEKDMLHWSVNLWVCHKLASIDDLENVNRYGFSKIAERMEKALLIEDPVPAKARRVERRQLHNRGYIARQAKPVRVVKRKAS